MIGGERDGIIPNGDTPEASVARGVVSLAAQRIYSGISSAKIGYRGSFASLAAPTTRSVHAHSSPKTPPADINHQGEEVLHLPVIVEAAESSPAAAREAASGIRKFLAKGNFQRAYVQYNAIMLVRILSDNPGKTFTKNLDSRFVTTTKELLRDGRDMSVQQILRETLDNFETEKKNDENLAPMREMWTKYKQKMEKRGGAPNGQGGAIRSGAAVTNQTSHAHTSYAHTQPQRNHHSQNYFARTHSNRALPPPQELAGRIEEARTSAKLLQQVVQSTAPAVFVYNDLIKEFVDRCQSASRSIQAYIHADNPAPDEDTLLTLIETNDQLSVALSRHQRAMLQARKVTGAGTSPVPPAPSSAPPPQTNGTSESPPNPAPAPGLFSRRKQPASQPPAQAQTQENPFSDHNETQAEPHDYGLPPSSTLNTEPEHTSKMGYHARSQSYDRSHENGRRADDEEDSPVSPEDVRRPPVQYRF